MAITAKQLTGYENMTPSQKFLNKNWNFKKKENNASFKQN